MRVLPPVPACSYSCCPVVDLAASWREWRGEQKWVRRPTGDPPLPLPGVQMRARSELRQWTVTHSCVFLKWMAQDAPGNASCRARAVLRPLPRRHRPSLHSVWQAEVCSLIVWQPGVGEIYCERRVWTAPVGEGAFGAVLVPASTEERIQEQKALLEARDEATSSNHHGRL